MNIINHIFIIIILNVGYIFSSDNAYPLADGSRQMGVFQPRIYGMKNNLEISTHPLFFLVKPNIRVKKHLGEFKGFGLASRYSFDYPTLLLKLIQRKGKFGLLSKDPDVGDIPNIFVFQGEWLVTKRSSQSSITSKIGMSICPGCELDKRHLIDLPLAYPRMALYHYGIAANTGIDLDYNFSDRITIKTDFDIIFIPDLGLYFEHKSLFHYHIFTKYTLSAGYKLTRGNYPYGSYWDIFPLIDLKWFWRK